MPGGISFWLILGGIAGAIAMAFRGGHWVSRIGSLLLMGVGALPILLICGVVTLENVPAMRGLAALVSDTIDNTTVVGLTFLAALLFLPGLLLLVLGILAWRMPSRSLAAPAPIQEGGETDG